MQWLSSYMYCVGICNDWAEIWYCVRICNDWVEICIALEYAMIELKYVLRWNRQWLSWNVYGVGICNDWVEIYIALALFNDWVEICITLEYAMIELKYVLRWNMQWLSWNKYCVRICSDWGEICMALEYSMIELKCV